MMTAEQAGNQAIEVAKKLSELLYKEIPGDDADSRALRNMTHGVFLALTTKNADYAYFDLLQQTAAHFTKLFDAFQEHADECPGRVKH